LQVLLRVGLCAGQLTQSDFDQTIVIHAGGACGAALVLSVALDAAADVGMEGGGLPLQ